MQYYVKIFFNNRFKLGSNFYVFVGFCVDNIKKVFMFYCENYKIYLVFYELYFMKLMLCLFLKMYFYYFRVYFKCVKRLFSFVVVDCYYCLWILDFNGYNDYYK